MKWVLPIVVMLTVPAHVSSFDGRQERGFPFVHFRGMGVDPFEMESRFGRNRQPEGDSSGVQEVVLDTCRNSQFAVWLQQIRIPFPPFSRAPTYRR